MGPHQQAREVVKEEWHKHRVEGVQLAFLNTVVTFPLYQRVHTVQFTGLYMSHTQHHYITSKSFQAPAVLYFISETIHQIEFFQREVTDMITMKHSI